MPKYLITLPPMSSDKIKTAWTTVIGASGGSALKMDKAYIDESTGQAICCWEAPDKKTVEELFTKVHISPQSIREVTEFNT